MTRTLYAATLCLSLFGCTTNVPAPDEAKITPKVIETISGSVKASGEPVNGMLVEAYTGDCFNGPLLAKTNTDAKGEFSFNGMKPDTYFIGVNEFRGDGKRLPAYTSTCSKGYAFTGKDDLNISILVNKR